MTVWLISEAVLDVTENQGIYPWNDGGRITAVADTKKTAVSAVNDYIKEQIRLARESVDDVDGVNVFVESIDESLVDQWVTYMQVIDTEEPHHKTEYSLLVKEWLVLES